MQITSSTNSTQETNNQKNTQQSTQTSSSSFNDILSKVNNKEEKSETQKLIDDIMSLIQKGLTVSELEMLEKLLAQIREKIKTEVKNDLNGVYDEDANKKEIRKLIENLEEAITTLKKRMSGVAIIKADDSKTSAKKEDLLKEFEGMDPEIIDFISKIEEVIKDIKDIKQGNEKKHLQSKQNHEELQLIEEIRNIYKEKENVI